MTTQGVIDAKAYLEETGHVVLKATSYRRAQERQHLAEARRAWAEQQAASSERWARGCLDNERHLRERCTYLYGLAASLGATPEQLTGPTP